MNEIFKEGDRVWCCVWGWGEITDIFGINDSECPIVVNFNGRTESYTLKGQIYTTSQRTLFFKEQQFDESRPEPEYEIGAWYWADIIGDKLPIKYLGEYHWRVNGVINRLDPKVICKIEEP